MKPAPIVEQRGSKVTAAHEECRSVHCVDFKPTFKTVSSRQCTGSYTLLNHNTLTKEINTNQDNISSKCILLDSNENQGQHNASALPACQLCMETSCMFYCKGWDTHCERPIIYAQLRKKKKKKQASDVTLKVPGGLHLGIYMGLTSHLNSDRIVVI